MGKNARRNESAGKARARGHIKRVPTKLTIGQWLRRGIPSLESGYGPSGLWTREEFIKRVLDFALKPGDTSRKYATVEEHRAFLAAHNRVV